MTLSWDQSGKGEAEVGDIKLPDLQALAVASGFARPDATANQPLAQRVDMARFLAAFGVKNLSAFKAKFFAEKVSASGGQAVFHSPSATPGAVAAAAAAASAAASKAAAVEPLPAEQFDAVLGTWKDLKWRIIPKPGGATMKPDLWYLINGAATQYEKGDCTEEKPMWAEKGGLDFNGGAIWEGWMKLKGASKEEAKKAFCQLYAEAMADPDTNLRKF